MNVNPDVNIGKVAPVDDLDRGRALGPVCLRGALATRIATRLR
jgi:hypothetical protein